MRPRERRVLEFVRQYDHDSPQLWKDAARVDLGAKGWIGPRDGDRWLVHQPGGGREPFTITHGAFACVARTGGAGLVIRFGTVGRIIEVILSRGFFASTRIVTELVSMGLPVDISRRGKLTRYLGLANPASVVSRRHRAESHLHLVSSKEERGTHNVSSR